MPINNTDPTIVTVLNTSIATEPGSYNLYPASLQYARGLASSGVLQSAIGHESTARIVSALLDYPLPMNREAYRQPVGAKALVFKLRGRPPEGRILSIDEIDAIGYDWFILERTGDLVRE